MLSSTHFGQFITAKSDVINSNYQIARPPRHNFLRLINLFFNRRVLGAGVRLGVTLCVLSKYERLGLLVFVLIIAL